jgi:hypothetical protein
VTENRSPLDARTLDGLMLGTDAAVAAYQEQRLKLEAARMARGNRERIDLANSQTGGDDQVA